jgi:hypothetical protein
MKKPTGTAPQQDAEKPKAQTQKERLMERANILAQFIESRGWISDDDVMAHAQKDLGWTLLEAFETKTLLARRHVITQRRGPDSTTLGWECMKSGAPQQVVYDNWRTITVRMRFLTEPLGKRSSDGKNFTHVRDEHNNIIFSPAGFRAMLEKAYDQTPLVSDEGIFKTSLGRIGVKCLGVQSKGDMRIVPRRPINLKKEAVGEMLHEGLPPGTTADWELRLPGSVFTDARLALLLDAAPSIGFSEAGNGKNGGGAGLFEWEKADGAV